MASTERWMNWMCIGGGDRGQNYSRDGMKEPYGKLKISSSGTVAQMLKKREEWWKGEWIILNFWNSARTQREAECGEREE